MTRTLFIFSLVAALLLPACAGHDASKGKPAPVKHRSADIKTAAKPLIVDIQPYSDMPADLSKYIFTEFSKIYPHTRLLAPVPLPRSAYYAKRDRYRADTLLHRLLAQTAPGYITLGLTTKDISTTKGKYADWGILGLGACPGRACIASIHRLHKNREQFFKIAIHELGHTQALPHCPVKTCFMRDAKGGNPTKQEKEFCPECKSVLKKAGWQL